ncbi:uncharacterized protein LOC121467887 [Drosophila elegans]|uniref:uncharacterized protein LOC121467887 n=1 Tax=Drosophila elegans TaxID=30023 RepID=UPI001BC85608|nr:uncharacterized protein LOC121467887 [Drosophila elegans]
MLSLNPFLIIFTSCRSDTAGGSFGAPLATDIGTAAAGTPTGRESLPPSFAHLPRRRIRPTAQFAIAGWRLPAPPFWAFRWVSAACAKATLTADLAAESTKGSWSLASLSSSCNNSSAAEPIPSRICCCLRSCCSSVSCGPFCSCCSPWRKRASGVLGNPSDMRGKPASVAPSTSVDHIFSSSSPVKPFDRSSLNKGRWSRSPAGRLRASRLASTISSEFSLNKPLVNWTNFQLC